MKKLVLVLFLVLMLSVSTFASTSAFNIQWWSQETYSNLPGNTLKLWAEGMEGRVGGQIGTGNIYYVDSGVSAAGDGSSWEKAVATIDAAINKCTANNGDIIYVAQGHAETIAAADGFDADVAGITIIGCGTGTDMPELTFSTTASTVAVGAANVTIVNLRFLAGISEVVTGLIVEAAGNNCTIIGCEFPEPATSTWEFDIGISVTGAANGVRISNCIVRRSATTGATAWLVIHDVNDIIVQNNNIYGEYSSAPIWSDDISFDAVIRNNIVSNITTGQFAIEFTGATTGICAYNAMYSDNVSTVLDPGSMKCIENYVSAAVNTTGVLVPAAVGDLSAISTWTGVQDANIQQIENFAALQDANSKILVTFASAQDANIQQIENFAVLNDANSKILVTYAGNQDANIGQLEVAALPSKGHPNYLTLDVNMTSATWNTVAAHQLVAVTGNVRITIMAICTHENIVTAGTNGTIALGFVGNASVIWAAAALDSWDLGEVASAVYGGVPTFPLAGGDAQSSLTHVLMDVVVTNGVDVIYTVGTSAGTLGSIKFHIWWTPLDSTGLCTAGNGT